MSPDIAALQQQIDDYFRSLFHQASGAPPDSIALSFEPVGLPIAPETFKASPADPTYIPLRATMWLSNTANRIPDLNAQVLPLTSKTIDGFYDILLIGATCAAPDALALFGALRSQAQEAFGSASGMHLVEPSPADWYDPSITTHWTAYTFTSAETSAPPSDSAPPPAPSQQGQWDWGVLPKYLPVFRPPPIIVQPPVALTPMLQSSSVAPTDTVPLRDVVAVSKNISIRAQIGSWAAPALTTSALAQPIQFARLLSPEPDAADFRLATDDARVVARQALITSQNPDYSTLMRANLSQVSALTTAQPVDSSALSVTFDYCLVTIDRPWLFQAFLALPNWYVPGYPAGAFSSGADTDAAGIFPAIPVAAIVIKDLQISASWTTTDAQAAQQALNLGPFSLVDSAFDQITGTLTCSGMQIIGWVCQIMPFLPPQDAPSV